MSDNVNDQNFVDIQEPLIKNTEPIGFFQALLLPGVIMVF